MKDEGKAAQSVESPDEIEAIVRGFEACTLGASEFRHREHLLVILWYLSQSTPREATRRMREALNSFLDHHLHDRGKYHETITVFWVKKVRALLDQGEAG
ncbi:MAG TPA: hypothetical protein VGO69_07340, partial [Pyrinomonadaceae bacterium]|nr:hypothetical protein [Pyrinomonadaceae bacterium]